MSARRHSGFTLLEMLVVLVIIAVLFCLVFPAINAMRRAAARNLTASRAQVMVNALKAYRADYPTWPGQIQGGSDWTYDNSGAGHMHSTIISALTNNPRMRVYSEVAENITTNSYLDAWDRPYVIAIDENNDGSVSMNGTYAGLNFTNGNVKDTVAIMSWGANPSNSTGWLYSWIR